MSVTTPPIPFFELNGIELLGRDDKGVTCGSVVRPWLAGTPEAGVQAGVLALADSLMSYAGATNGTDGVMPVTVTMQLDFWSPPPPLGTRLLGQASIAEVPGDVALIRGEVETKEGTVATGSLRSILVPLGEPSPRGAASPSPVPVRTVPPVSEPSEEPCPGLERLLALPAATILGLRVLARGSGRVELSAVAPAELERTEGVVHGGAVPIIGSLACAAALATEAPTAPAARLSLATDYLRPTRIGEPIGVNARIVHRSRRIVSVHAELVNGDGRPTARIYETAVLAVPSER